MPKRYDLEVDQEDQFDTRPRRYRETSRFSGVATFVALVILVFAAGLAAEYFFGMPLIRKFNDFYQGIFPDR